MAIGKDTALRLILIDDQANEAEAIVSSLRNAGIAVRPQRLEDAEALAQALAQQPVDLVLAEHASTGVPFEDVAAVVAGSGRDVPLLAVLDGVSDELLDGVQQQGAQGVALRGRPLQLVKAVRDAWQDLEARRSQRQLEAQIRETERRCDMLIDSSRDPIAYIHEGMHIRANQAYLEMFGYEAFDDIEGMSLLDLVTPRHVADFKDLLKRLSKGEPPPPRHELTARDSEGKEFPAVMEFTSAHYEGEPCLQVVFRRQALDVDPELARQLEDLKQRDQATGLLNRQTFLHRLEDAVADAANNGAVHGLLLVEPDHAAQLLQVVGLGGSDEMMASLARRLAQVVPAHLETARVAEYQFAVLVNNGDHVRTADLAEDIRRAFAEHVVEVGENSLNTTVSIGGVQVSEKIASVPQVLAKAQHGLKQAHDGGGNALEIFDPSAIDRAEEERIRTWVSRIEDALEHDRFVLHYQPIVSLQGEREEMYEVFLRMTAPMGELVPPLTFFQIAEDHGLLPAIDAWVVRRAVKVVAERLAAGHRTRLLVKLTQASLQQQALVELLSEELTRNGIPGELIVLSIPEAKAFAHLRAAQQFQAGLAEAGCLLCMEQFGSGLNSSQLLSHLPVDMLKLDHTITRELGDAGNQDRVRHIAALAKAGNMRTIADYVEDASNIAFLFGSGIDYVQGQFMAPVTALMDYDFS